MPEPPEKETTDFVFAGNVGKAQNLGVVLKAAEIIQDEKIDDKGKKIVFHIIGNGQALDDLQNYAKEHKIENVVFHGRKPPEEMPKYYAMADAMKYRAIWQQVSRYWQVQTVRLRTWLRKLDVVSVEKAETRKISLRR